MLWGIGLLAAAGVLLELLMFRLCAAAIGHPLAVFAAIVTPGASGLTAAVVGWRSRSLSPDALVRRAAHLAICAGALVVLGAIAITWTSQDVARADGFGGWFHVGVILAATTLGAMCLCSAAALVMQRLQLVVGRACFAIGVGGAIGALAVPIVLGTVGAPRGLIGLGLVAAAAAASFGRAAGEARPQWSVIASLPLVVVSLVSGDYGEPWMKVRTDSGRRSRVDHRVWTSQGVFAVSNVTRSKARFGVDRQRTVPFGVYQKPPKKPRFAVVDLPFLTNVQKEERGPVLVFATGAGRQIEAALAYGHPRIDAVEPDARVVSALLLERYQDVSRGLFQDPSRVRFMFGDGRVQLRGLANDYEHIIVMSKMALAQTVPRFISSHDRLFTVGAVQEFLSHLRAGGTLLLQAPKNAGAAALRSAIAALPDPSRAPEQVVACQHQEHLFILVNTKPLSPGRTQILTKKCRRSQSSVEFPLEAIKRGRRDLDRLSQEREAKLATLNAARPIHDDRPFLGASVSPGSLRAQSMAAVRALQPMPALAPKAKKGAPPNSKYVAPPTAAGLAGAATLLCLAFLVLGMLTPTGTTKASGRVPLLMRTAFPLFGASLALCMFALTDVLMRLIGNGLAGWSLLIPLGLVGVGGGRLMADTLAADPARIRRGVILTALLSVVWLLVMYAVTNTLGASGGLGAFEKVLLAMMILLMTGGLLGLPLALGLKLMGHYPSPPVVWSWSMHVTGWGLGGSVAALAVHYAGVRNLWLMGLGSFALGAVALVVASRERLTGAEAVVADPGASTG